jgi:hypothetical protein
MSSAKWLPSETCWAVIKDSDRAILALCDSEAEAWDLAADVPGLDIARVRRTVA